jgi:septal ring factor EnvC (AmiA/AmiB activator)
MESSIFDIFGLLNRVEHLERKMANITAELTAVQAELTATQTDVTNLAAGVTSLTATVAALQNQIATQGDVLSPESQTALDALVAQAGTLQTAADAAAAELPVPPVPGPASLKNSRGPKPVGFGN